METRVLSLYALGRDGGGALRVEIKLSVSNLLVWQTAGSAVELDAAGLLTFLGRSWAYLSWEEGLPLNLPLLSLREVREALNVKRSSASPVLRKEYEKIFDDFLLGHDLARAGSSETLASVVLVKQGLDGWILQEDSVMCFALSELLEPLEAFASDLARALASRGTIAEEAAASVWRSRWDYTPRGRRDSYWAIYR
jgi:hypothetical protein